MVSRYNVMVLALLLTGKGSCKRSAQQDLEKYVAASTEDIARVFQLEKDLWSHLKEYQEGSASNKDVDVINKFLTDTKFTDIVEDGSLEHVSNPFHAYHCLKRTTRLWEKMVLKLSKQNKLKKVKQLLRRFPEEEDFQEGAAFGLLTIQLYYNISFTVIMLQNGNNTISSPIAGDDEGSGAWRTDGGCQTSSAGCRRCSPDQQSG